MAGTLGNLRGATRCLRCNRVHESSSVSFGVYGMVSICPGHQVGLKKVIRTGKTPHMIDDEIIDQSQSK